MARSLNTIHQVAQVAWVRAHGTTVNEYCRICGDTCEFGPTPPQPPRRIPSAEIDAARQAIHLAVQRYLLRLFRCRFLSEAALWTYARSVELRLEKEDLEKKYPSPNDSDNHPTGRL